MMISLFARQRGVSRERFEVRIRQLMVFGPDDGYKPLSPIAKRRLGKSKQYAPTIWNRPRNISHLAPHDQTNMSSAPALTAEYSAPHSELKAFTHTLPPCSGEPSAAERTASLTALRSAVTDTQDQINALLTHKMDEDNKNAGTLAAAEDAKAEELYGEETIEED
jgi:hypothetical protein